MTKTKTMTKTGKKAKKSVLETSGLCSNGIFIQQRDYMKINYLFICRHTTLYQS